MTETSQKILLFVSTGRCATKRIADILRERLPEDIKVIHQMPISRLANIIGNLMYRFGPSEKIKKLIYQPVLDRYAAHNPFVCTDPLTAMVIPQKIVLSRQTWIVHLMRDKESFARSFFRHTRQSPLSWLAHNFIPFWQPGLYPLENIFNKNVVQAYARIADLKNEWFSDRYAKNPNYRQIKFEDMVHSSALEEIIRDVFDLSITISDEDWEIKANQTQ